jgi:Pentapeptide repeats (8 copies)
MANPEHLAILARGVQVWNTWREENPRVIPDLSKTSGRSASLYGANFSNANLVNAYLAQADLRLARFSGAVAREAFLHAGGEPR